MMITKILFICHGNICRSVLAQYIFQDMVNRKNIADRFVIESAATSTEETRRFALCADQIEEGCKGLLEYLEGNGRL